MREPAEPSGSVPGSAIGGLTHLLWLVWTVGPLSLAPQVGHSRSGAVSSQVVSVDLYQSRRPVPVTISAGGMKPMALHLRTVGWEIPASRAAPRTPSTPAGNQAPRGNGPCGRVSRRIRSALTPSCGRDGRRRDPRAAVLLPSLNRLQRRVGLGNGPWGVLSC
jgi:hypothetical protein